MTRIASAALLLGVTGVPAGQAQDKLPVVEMDTSMGKIKIELYEREGADHRQELPRLRGRQALRRHHLPSRDPQLHDPGRRLRARHEGEEDARAHQERIGQRPAQRERHASPWPAPSEPDSASAQFFINVKDNAFLDKENARDKVGYAVFGRVIDGMDVVDKIRAVETGERGGHEDVPVKDVVIRSVRLIK